MNLKRYTREFRTNLNLAIPVILGSLGHIITGLADDVMVGVLGPVELAATSLGNSLVFIAIAFGMGFSFALTPLISEADGEKDFEKGRRLFHHGLTVNIILGVFMFLALVLARPFLKYFNQPPEVIELAIPYFKIVAMSMIPVMIFQAMKQFADGMSKTKHAMNATIISNVLNIAFNSLLIYGIWIFPKMGIVGAAIGTFISRIAIMFIMFYLLNKDKVLKPYLKLLSIKDFSAEIFNKIINLGFPTALQMLFEVGLFVAGVLLAGVLGAYPQAANQIALKLSSTTFMVAVGIGVAATVRIGNQKGKRDFINLRRIAFSNQLMVLMIMSVFTVLFLLFNRILPWGFTQEIDVINIAAELLIVAGFFQLADGLQAVLMASLRGIQDVWIPSLLTFIAYWVIAFPVSYYLGLHTQLKTLGIWIGLSVGLFSAAIMLFLRFNYKTKQLIINHHDNT